MRLIICLIIMGLIAGPSALMANEADREEFMAKVEEERMRGMEIAQEMVEQAEQLQEMRDDEANAEASEEE